MTGGNSRPEPQGNEGFRARPCYLLKQSTWKRRLNHEQRTLLGIMLFRLGTPLKHASCFYGFQDDFKVRRTRYELKKIYRKQLHIPTCATFLRSGLCSRYCGRIYPDLQSCKYQLYASMVQVSVLSTAGNCQLDTLNRAKEYYQTCFEAPDNLQYKFRFFKIETPNRWILCSAKSPEHLTKFVRKTSSKEPILGIFYSLGRFVSPRWAEKDSDYLLLNYSPVLDYDLHIGLTEESSDYEKQDNLLSRFLKEKMDSIDAEMKLRRVIFSGGGFHFYLELTRDQIKEYAKATNADPIFDDKRVVRLENSLNLKYGDARICGEVGDHFSLEEFIL